MPNKPFLRRLPTVQSLVLLSALCVLVACGGKAEREAAHLERGIALYEEGAYDKARLELKTARQLNPENVDALYHLALIDRAQQDWQSALINLSQAVEMAPDFIPAQLALAEFQFLGEEFDNVLKTLAKVEEIDAGNTTAAALRGAVYLRQDKLDQAIAEAERCLATDPNHKTGVPLLVGIRVRQNRSNEAIGIVEKAIEAEPQSTSLRQLKIALHQKLGRNQEVVSALEELIELEPQNAEHRVALARLLISMDQTSKAQEVLEAFIASQAESESAKLLLIDFLANQRGLESAEQKIAEFSQGSENEAAYLLTLSRLYEKFEKTDRSKDVLARVLTLDAPIATHISAHARLGGYALAEKDLETAKEQAEAILALDSANPSGLMLRARLLVEQGDPGNAIIDLRNLLRTNPDSEDALRLLGIAYARIGNLQLATETFDQLANIAPDDTSVLLELASLHASQGANVPALDLVDRVLAADPSSLIALRLRGDIQLSQGDAEQAAQIGEAIISQSPQEADGYALHGQALLALGQTAQSQTALTKAYRLSPSQDNLGRLVYVQKQVDGVEASLSFLEEEVKAGRNVASVHLLAAQLKLEVKDYQGADRSFSAAAAARPDWPVPYIQQVQLYSAINETERALDAANDGLKQFPGNPEILFLKARLTARAGKRDEAIALYEGLLGSNLSDRAANNLANLLLAQENATEPEIQRAAELAEQFSTSENPIHLDTYGWIRYKQGHPSEALIILTKAVQNGADFPDVYYHLGVLHNELGNRALAIANLKTAVEMPGSFVDRKSAEDMLSNLNSKRTP